MQTGQVSWRIWLQGSAEGEGRLPLVLIALPAGGRGGDKLDAGATAPEAPAATGAEARAPQARSQTVPTTSGEGVAAAPTDAEAAATNAAASSVATGDGGGDHGCRKRGDVIRPRAGEETLGASGLVPQSLRSVDGGLPHSNSLAHFVRSLSFISAWFSLRPSVRHPSGPKWLAAALLLLFAVSLFLPELPGEFSPPGSCSGPHAFPLDSSILPCCSVPISLCGPGSGVSLPSGSL